MADVVVWSLEGLPASSPGWILGPRRLGGRQALVHARHVRRAGLGQGLERTPVVRSPAADRGLERLACAWMPSAKGTKSGMLSSARALGALSRPPFPARVRFSYADSEPTSSHHTKTKQRAAGRKLLIRNQQPFFVIFVLGSHVQNQPLNNPIGPTPPSTSSHQPPPPPPPPNKMAPLIPRMDVFEFADFDWSVLPLPRSLPIS